MHWILYLSENGDDNHQWAKVNNNEIIVGPHHGNLTIAAADIGEEPLTVVISGDFVVHHQLQVPIKQPKQIQQVIGYALEDELANELDENHFAISTDKASQTTHVDVIKCKDLENYLALLKQNRLKVQTVITESHLIPNNPKGWSIFFTDSKCLYKTNFQQTYCLQRQLALELINITLADDGESTQKPESIAVWGASEQELMTLQQLAEDIPVHSHPLTPESILPCLIKQLNTTNVINLLQGRYKNRQLTAKTYQQLRLPAVLLAAWFILHLGFKLFTVNQYEEAIDHLDQQATAVYQETFPKDKRIVSLRAQMKNHLTELRANAQGHSFMRMLTTTSSHFAAAPNVTLLGMRYSQSRKDFELELQTTNYQALEAFRKSLETDFLVEVRAANIGRNNQVSSRLKLQEKRS